MNNNLSKEDCIKLIQEKFSALNRLPKRSDFSNYEVMIIKSFFGPWPRALESAGVKPPRNDDKLELQRQKRVRSKINKREFKKSNKENII